MIVIAQECESHQKASPMTSPHFESAQRSLLEDDVKRRDGAAQYNVKMRELYSELEQMHADLSRYGVSLEWGRQKSWKHKWGDAEVLCVILNQSKRRCVIFHKHPFYYADGFQRNGSDDSDDWTFDDRYMGSTPKDVAESIARSLLREGELPAHSTMASYESIAEVDWQQRKEQIAKVVLFAGAALALILSMLTLL